MASRWTKWWWLRLNEFNVWSTSERRAFGVLLLTWVSATAPFAFLLWYELSRLWPLGSKTSAVFSIFFALSLGFPGLRGLVSSIFPNIIINGDNAAASRMGGRVYLPTNEFWIRGFWWIDGSAGVSDWSAEQVKVRQRIFGIVLVLFLPSFLLLSALLMAHGVSERAAAAIGFMTTMPTALYAGRQMAKSNWPDLVRKADDDAVKLAERSVPPQN